MLGLIKKDLLMIKSYFKVLALLLFVYAIMAFKGEMDLAFLLPFMSVMIMISTFNYDTYNKWDAYACSLPNGRNNSVRAKYLSTIILIIVSTLIITILAVGISYARTKTMDLETNLSNILGAVLATILLQAFMYPSIYKFGIEKARIGMFIVIFGVAIFGSIMANFIDLNALIDKLNFLTNYFIIILPIIMVLILYISYKISEKIYQKKEY